MEKLKYFYRRAICVCCLFFLCASFLNGCAFMTEHGKEHASFWGWFSEQAWNIKEHKSKIVVKDNSGTVIAKTEEKDVINRFSEMMETAVKGAGEQFCIMDTKEELLYVYEAWDNDKYVIFEIYGSGDIIATGAGELKVFIDISEAEDEIKEYLTGPEKWIDIHAKDSRHSQ